MNWLKNKKNQILFFLVSFLLLVLLYNINTYHLEDLNQSFYDAFFVILIPNTIFSFVNIFIKNIVWKYWLKINIVLSVIGFILIFLSSPDPEFSITLRGVLAIFYWILYSLISLGIIIYQSFKKN